MTSHARGVLMTRWPLPFFSRTFNNLMGVITVSLIFALLFIPACIIYFGAWWNEEPITFMDAVRKSIRGDLNGI